MGLIWPPLPISSVTYPVTLSGTFWPPLAIASISPPTFTETGSSEGDYIKDSDGNFITDQNGNRLTWS